ncbi:uncharacterized protein METZ01_LOCUS74356 [marine metagenome]|jgi:hypothetical protein|uniref:Uncharacterized protein n=1 Tax=marine metagenome TaxID=408172 RepID=A0A381TZT1_9ZZZZ|tara:strand:+ start:275 stop:484 length:210 start_codon:yes stop_codon:yes gene_type:complete
MIFILIIGIVTLIFGLLLLVSPNTILKMERQANRLVMTDPFFMKYRIPIGSALLVAAAYMLYTYSVTIG